MGEDKKEDSQSALKAAVELHGVGGGAVGVEELEIVDAAVVAQATSCFRSSTVLTSALGR